jgi:hypothetical protein
MDFNIYRFRQVVGLIYILLYISIFFLYAFILKDDQSWVAKSPFTATVLLWFSLSLAVKVSMFLDRSSELLNLVATLAFLSIAFVYNPRPVPIGFGSTSIENFCYYLHFIGGSACDFFDFLYEAVPKRRDG